MAKIEWTTVKTAQAQLDQPQALVIKPVSEVPLVELLLSSALHHCRACYLGRSSHPRAVSAVSRVRVFGR